MGVCSDPRCPEPAAYRGKCQRHARQRERETNRAGASIYRTKRWQMTRKKFLLLHPLCECGAINTDVHHRVDLAAGGDPWSFENLEALCHSCHSRTTRARQATTQPN